MEWHKSRLGIPTASNFDCLITPTGKASANKARQTYMNDLLFERLTGSLATHGITPAMERGTLLEPDARKQYEFENSRDVRKVGFCYPLAHAGKWGASPDGICEDRGIEIKCPLPQNLVGLLLSDEEDAVAPYIMQMQACMWVTGLALWDLYLYTPDPGIPHRTITVKRDEKLIDAFEEHIPTFCADLRAAEIKLRAMPGGGITIPEIFALPGDNVIKPEAVTNAP